MLVWEGIIGSLYVVDETWTVTQRDPGLRQPGHRYAFMFALADPAMNDEAVHMRYEVAGKLMALAGFRRRGRRRVTRR